MVLRGYSFGFLGSENGVIPHYVRGLFGRDFLTWKSVF